MTPPELQTRVRALLDEIRVERGNIGFMSAAIYDTAWVSMVAKQDAWLFPESFRWLIDSQLADGSWASYCARVDGILNTGAALLAILKHMQQPRQLAAEFPAESLQARVERGQTALAALLRDWNVAETDHVGFEILVPMILEQLHASGLDFDFADRELLLSMHAAKLAKFKPEYLYMPISTTALHSLEAFVGMIDYNKVKHHKQFGAYMASPSSTAAVLIYASDWDDESEEYLRWTFAEGAGQGSGGFPSAFPSTYFEITWVLTTLLEGSFTVEDFGKERAAAFTAFLRKSLDEHKGRIGFAPSVGVDVDDTAKTLLSLSLMGAPAPHDAFLQEFEVDTHFRTYKGERNPSFTANCNALVALLSQPDVDRLAPQICKIASFLSKTCWDMAADGIITDKWNLSTFYPTMLLAEAFSALIRVWSQGRLPSIPASFIDDQISVSLFQVLVRTLSSQNADGSWTPPATSSARQAALDEVTAYATLTVCKAAALPIVDCLRPVVDEAVARAKAFLGRPHPEPAIPGYLWVEKVTYGSRILCEAYVIAALNSHPHALDSALIKMTATCLSPVSANAQALAASTVDAQTRQAFAHAWQLDAAFIESCLYRPYLERLAADVVPDAKGHRALEVVPFVWTVCNVADGLPLTTEKLRQQMSASLLRQLFEQVVPPVQAEATGAHSRCIRALAA